MDALALGACAAWLGLAVRTTPKAKLIATAIIFLVISAASPR